MKNREYSTKDWLNPISSYATSYISCFDGNITYHDGIHSSTFISIADCNKSITIHKNEQDTLVEFISKLKIIEKAISNYIIYLQDDNGK
jgi:hypothetical protein